ncbi:MAG TPA: glycosyltransferase [Acidisoma sp.]|uniref:glycosyltransferase n=1 Tax=Acidisoma sp. TaxID=1872115 RepID=UPI002C1DFC36|nr:glycosyltransferase [Acidisoma sp.]HTI01899.1 glycosyltransferase [Acidisoma sp.]
MSSSILSKPDDVWAIVAPDVQNRSSATASRRRAPRIAIVHEWLQVYAGSERVLEQLLICFPDADLFAIVDFMPPHERAFLKGRKVTTSFVQKLPGARRFFRHFLGLMPIAVEQFDVSSYDIVISSNHAVAKGVVTGPDQVHISYVHSPMRYIWDLQHQYLRQAQLGWSPKALYVRWLFNRMRQWDYASAQHVDHFIANSSYIARRIKKAYAREAFVIHPPVDVTDFTIGGAREDFYLLAGRFVPYKRADLVVRAFAADGSRRLVVVGEGPEAARVHAAAGGAPNIEFRGRVPHLELVRFMQSARAAIFAAEEDFGIAMVEAQACGTPVIAFSKGGALDIIDTAPGTCPTGVLFEEQSAESITDALSRFESLANDIVPETCRANALRFSQERFRDRIQTFVQDIAAAAD